MLVPDQFIARDLSPRGLRSIAIDEPRLRRFTAKWANAFDLDSIFVFSKAYLTIQ